MNNRNIISSTGCGVCVCVFAFYLGRNTQQSCRRAKERKSQRHTIKTKSRHKARTLSDLFRCLVYSENIGYTFENYLRNCMPFASLFPKRFASSSRQQKPTTHTHYTVNVLGNTRSKAKAKN